MTDSPNPLAPARIPLAAERHAHLLAALARDGAVRVADISATLGVTPVTVRRDISELDRLGLLRRVHGGAVTRSDTPRPAGTPSGTTSPTTVITAASLGVMVPSLDYYWPGIVAGMEAEASERAVGITLRGSSYSVHDERPALENLAHTDGVQALVIAPRTDRGRAGEIVDWLAASGLPTVLVERDAGIDMTAATPSETDPQSPGGIDVVRSDHTLGAALAVRHLLALGHQRLGLVVTTHSPTSAFIARGWRAACAELGVKKTRLFEAATPARDTADFSAAIDAALETALTKGTTGLLVHSDPEAFAIVQHAQERGLSIPGDLSVIAYDDEVAGKFSPALTAVQPPREAIGRGAVTLAVNRLANPRRPAHRLLIAPQLVQRQSTAPARASRR
ncbi:MAG: substrate-binding domain-containing protein [Cellulomonadaceae bacterium]|jgi:DNA-binding LacI/PurR family transcriptional regulator|nr:substrate-binding domain-containing protein [Cellulomonadaceae bacterium]